MAYVEVSEKHPRTADSWVRRQVWLVEKAPGNIYHIHILFLVCTILINCAQS